MNEYKWLNVMAYHKEIVNALQSGKEVVIENGCINDLIISSENRILCTTGAYFSKFISLVEFESIDTEWINDTLVVTVQ